MKASIFLLALGVAGCANQATGIVPIGDGIYMSSRVVHMGWSGGAVKATLFQEAATFCAQSGKKVQPVNSTSQDSGIASYASAEVQFRCI